MRVRYRIDGVLRRPRSSRERSVPAVVSRVKILSDLDIAERRDPAGRPHLARGRGQADRPPRRDAAGRATARRSSCASSTSRKVMIELEQLGMLPQALERFTKAFAQAHGAVLVTGPTGSGKSTSLYARAQPAQHDREEHHHDRGPGRVPARRHHAGAGQPQGRPDVRLRPALDDACRPRHHHGRRDPRPRDGADRHRGGAHRPPRALHAAHQRRAGRGHAPDRDGHRALPRRLGGRLRGRPAPRAPAVRGVQAAHDDHLRGHARQRLQRRPRPRGLRARRLRALRRLGLQGPDRPLRGHVGLRDDPRRSPSPASPPRRSPTRPCTRA